MHRSEFGLCADTHVGPPRMAVLPFRAAGAESLLTDFAARLRCALTNALNDVPDFNAAIVESPQWLARAVPLPAEANSSARARVAAARPALETA